MSGDIDLTKNGAKPNEINKMAEKIQLSGNGKSCLNCSMFMTLLDAFLAEYRIKAW